MEISRCLSEVFCKFKRISKIERASRSLAKTGLFFRFFLFFFRVCFQRLSGRCFFLFCVVSGVPWGVTFGDIFEKYAFFQEKVVPSFLIDPTVIWLDFEAPGLPESREIEKKMLLIFCCFFGSKKIRRDQF